MSCCDHKFQITLGEIMNASTQCQVGTSVYLQEIVVLLLVRRQQQGHATPVLATSVHLSALIHSFVR